MNPDSLAISGATALLLNRNQKTTLKGNPSRTNKLPKIPNQTTTTTTAKKKITNKTLTKSSLPKVSQLSVAIAKPLTISEQALQSLSVPAKNDNSCGEVMIRFNHYRKTFPIHNGVLKWEDVDNEYAISFAYHGKYHRRLLYIPPEYCNENFYKEIALLQAQQHQSPDLKHSLQYAIHDEEYQYFINLKNEEVYMLQIQEAEEGIIPVTSSNNNINKSGTLRATELASLSQCNNNTTVASKLITEELKGLAVKNQLQSHEAKDLLERRELEDILYGKSS